jgi:hypothetical protein
MAPLRSTSTLSTSSGNNLLHWETSSNSWNFAFIADPIHDFFNVWLILNMAVARASLLLSRCLMTHCWNHHASKLSWVVRNHSCAVAISRILSWVVLTVCLLITFSCVACMLVSWNLAVNLGLYSFIHLIKGINREILSVKGCCSSCLCLHHFRLHHHFLLLVLHVLHGISHATLEVCFLFLCGFLLDNASLFKSSKRFKYSSMISIVLIKLFENMLEVSVVMNCT